MEEYMNRVYNVYVSNDMKLTSPDTIVFSQDDYGLQYVIARLPNTFIGGLIEIMIRTNDGEIHMDEVEVTGDIAQFEINRFMVSVAGRGELQLTFYNRDDSRRVTTNTIPILIMESIHTTAPDATVGCGLKETIGDKIDELHDLIDTIGLDEYARLGYDAYFKNTKVTNLGVLAGGKIYAEGCAGMIPILYLANGVRLGCETEELYFDGTTAKITLDDTDRFKIHNRQDGGSYTILHTGNIYPYLGSNMRTYYGLHNLDIKLTDADIPYDKPDMMILKIWESITYKPAKFVMAVDNRFPNMLSNMPAPNVMLTIDFNEDKQASLTCLTYRNSSKEYVSNWVG
jgi:hypothetical protein